MIPAWIGSYYRKRSSLQELLLLEAVLLNACDFYYRQSSDREARSHVRKLDRCNPAAPLPSRKWFALSHSPHSPFVQRRETDSIFLRLILDVGSSSDYQIGYNFLDMVANLRIFHSSTAISPRWAEIDHRIVFNKIGAFYFRVQVYSPKVVLIRAILYQQRFFIRMQFCIYGHDSQLYIHYCLDQVAECVRCHFLQFTEMYPVFIINNPHPVASHTAESSCLVGGFFRAGAE